MTITDCYELPVILREIETMLAVSGSDYEERDIDVVVSRVRERLERQYQLTFIEGKIDSTSVDLSAIHSSAVIFIDNAARVHAKVSGYCQIARFKKKLSLSLGNINYLGFTQETLKENLFALGMEATQPMVSDNVQSLKKKLAFISVCAEKRLILMMIIAYEIGLGELASACAEILLLACL